MTHVTADTGSKIINSATGTVADAVDIGGGYFTVEDLSTVPNHAKVFGALCYCSKDNKFYHYMGSSWRELNLGDGSSGGEGTSEMSAIGFQLLEKENNGSTKKFLATNATISGVNDLQSLGMYIGTDGISVVGGNYNNTHGFQGTKLLTEGGKLLSDNVEITGGTISGNTSFRNEYTLSNNSKLYMSSYNALNSASISLGSTSLDDIRDYTYMGADGIGTYHIQALTGGNISSSSKTYMAAGKLVSNDVDITGGTVSTTTLRGTTAVHQGGTGRAMHDSNAILTGNGTSAVNNISTANGAFYATSDGGAAKFGTLPIAQGGTGSKIASGGAINLLSDLSNVTYSANHSVTIPYTSIENSNGFTTGSVSGIINGLILHISSPNQYYTATAEYNPSTGKSTYHVYYTKEESEILLPDPNGLNTVIQILYIK